MSDAVGVQPSGCFFDFDACTPACFCFPFPHSPTLRKPRAVSSIRSSEAGDSVSSILHTKHQHPLLPASQPPNHITRCPMLCSVKPCFTGVRCPKCRLGTEVRGCVGIWRKISTTDFINKRRAWASCSDVPTFQQI